MAEFYARLTPEGRARLGVDLAQLRPDGHELAVAFLKPLNEGNGPIDAETVRRETTERRDAHRGAAAQLMRHRVSLLGGYPVQELGDPIDWFRAPEGDWQWPTHLSRHYWLKPLAWHYRATGDVAAAQKVVDVLFDWTARFPIGVGTLDNRSEKPAPDGVPVSEGVFRGYVDGPWTSLSAHARVDYWTELLQLLWDAPAMTNQAAATLLNSLLGDHRRSLLTFPRAMNQFQGVATSLIHLGAWYPWFTGTSEAEDVGWERMARYATTEIYPDGSLAECSPIYGLGCVLRLHDTVLDAGRRGREVPPALPERVRLAMRYVALFSDPLGRSPRIAKGGGSVRGALATLNAAHHDPEVAFVAAGARGDAKPSLNHLWPWAGHAVMRSGWGEDATWLFFDAGPRGSGHHDQAWNSIQLVAHGEWLLTDPGYYSYSTTGEAGAMSAYLHSTAAHNTALVDGQGQLSRPPSQRWGPNAEAGTYPWAEDDRAVTAESVYPYGYGKDGQIVVRHRRRVVFHRAEQRLTVTDTFEGQGRHRVDLRWQLAPGAEVKLDGAAATVRSKAAGLLLSSTSPALLTARAVEGQKAPLAGWYSEGYGKLQPAPMLEVTAEAELPLTVTTELRVQRAGD